mmetsp:Transcript_24965/g.39179  ORF Transcript_24965/g.39179 Transcript_24965/m.39179 type:complete len:208 (-) Transcript_24965:177-800(-)
MLAVIGVAILELSSESAFSYGDAWSLLQPLGFGVGFWKIEKVMKKFPGKGKQLTALQLLVVWLTGAAWSCVESGGSPDMSHIVDRLTSWEVMGAVVWTGCVTTAMTVMLQTTSLGVLSSTETSVLYSTEPVWAALFARAVLEEKTGGHTVVGGALILMACLIASLNSSNSAVDVITPHEKSRSHHISSSILKEMDLLPSGQANVSNL